MSGLIPVNPRLLEIEQEILEAEGQISEAQELEIATLLADLGRYIVNREYEAERAKDLAKRLRDYASGLEHLAEIDRARMAKAMEIGTESNVRDEFFTAVLKNGKGSVEVLEPNSVPRIYMKKVETWKVDTELLRAGIEAGEPGALACAKINKNKHVAITVKKNKTLAIEAEQILGIQSE